MMVDKVLVQDIFQTYCYFYVNEADRSTFLIDPGAEARRILDIAKKKDYTIKAIVLTHGHFDHTGAVKEVREALDIPVYAHKRADEYLLDPYMNLSRLYTDDILVPDAKKLSDSDCLYLNETILYSGHSLSVTVGKQKTFFA